MRKPNTMNHIDHPSDHEQTKKILQFQDLTGSRDALEGNNWYVESRVASDKIPLVHNDPSVQQVCVAESEEQPFGWRWTGSVGNSSFFEFARSFFWNRPRYRYPLSEWTETAYTYYVHRTNTLKAFTRAATKYAVMFFILVFYATLSITEGCSSRSTPKPRPTGPTPRPNITFHTYACPPEYATVYCLNGATCFTVKIGEHLLYNCECAEGFMGPRCEFKDLDSSYLLSRKHILLETASIAFGATLAIFLVVIVCIFLYIRYHRRQKQINTKMYMY